MTKTWGKNFNHTLPKPNIFQQKVFQTKKTLCEGDEKLWIKIIGKI